jgi:predicted glycogen debranching enzyme
VLQLARAAEQFIVRRPVCNPEHAAAAAVTSVTTAGVKSASADRITTDPGAAGRTSAGTSLIAGYPWFGEWSRDTMIALPGIATALGRFDVAADTLRTYAGYIDGGMLPNRFPDGGESPEFNTADATLWFFLALDDYLSAHSDPELLSELFPILLSIIHAHVDGTRHGIQVDPADGLLRAGEPGSQLTWMDARYDGVTFTPRVGKPVEINALWMNALDVTTRLAARLHDSSARRICQTLLVHASANFQRFWNAEGRCLYDVIDVDGGGGVDGRLRPNQLFAVSLPYTALSDDQMRAIVDICAQRLVTSRGLRSLDAADPAYVGRYAGTQQRRDAAYHQGTVWGWLLGPFAWAHFRVYQNAPLAQSFLAPMAEHLNEACVGSLSEIFDGDPPHAARGCFAQAWSVAELLRAWLRLEAEISKGWSRTTASLRKPDETAPMTPLPRDSS